MNFPDTSKFNIVQLLCYEAALRDLQAKYYLNLVFSQFGSPPPKPGLSPEELSRLAAPVSPTSIDKANAAPLTKAQIECMQNVENGLKSARAMGECHKHTGLRDRYIRLLPRQIRARGKDCISVKHIKTVIRMLQCP